MKYLGIDGGGTKTTFLLVDENYGELSRNQSGPSNWLSVGRESAKASIIDGVSRLGATPDVVCAGFAGAGRPEGAAFYRGVLASLFPNAKIAVKSDAFIASVGALGGEPGVLLIAGTGSIVFGRRPDGTIIRVGGWGPHFGDEGSGFWIGREAIRRALRNRDSGEPPELGDRIARVLNLGAIVDVIPAWSTGTIGVPEIAGLFKEVVALYPAGPANEILQDAASHLRWMVENGVKRAGLGNCRKSCNGSVASHPVMRNLVGIEFDDPQHSPEWGAVIWAREQFADAL